ncbi:Hypothetical predicted protein [Olea europaea subsp. europaea]|uniref:Uncharacterized protein n=1 Tax=Olea europaea subsp. europaea TaxID=158383 RepID=A0A8S0QZ94_OLEEU|nr:Hypothetical predicted protein [Olea europaea subsp. europaea]
MTRLKPENPMKKATDFSDGKVEICDLDPSESESAMQYMIGAEYTKHVQLDLSRGERRTSTSKERSVHDASTSEEPSLPIAKTTTPLLAITDCRIGHSDVQIDDDDFVDTPPRWHSPTFHSNSPIRKGQSTDASTPRMPQNTGPQSNDAIEKLRKHFNKEVFELHSKNQLLISELDDVKSQMSCIKSGQHKKMNFIVRLQGEIRTDLLDIKSNMKLMSESITAMISSSTDEVMNKISEKFATQPVEVSEPTDDAKHIGKTGELKGKGKMDTANELSFHCTLEPPSFDQGVAYMQPSMSVSTYSREVQARVDPVISDVVKDMESETKEHIDVCFYYIRQLARNGQNVKYVATTTASLFQTKLKNIYPKFKQDTNMILNDSSLLNDITGARIPLRAPWSDVDIVLIPICQPTKLTEC